MEAAASGQTDKVPRKVAQEYLAATGSPKNLPERVAGAPKARFKRTKK